MRFSSVDGSISAPNGEGRGGAARRGENVALHPCCQAAENAERRELFPVRKKSFDLGFKEAAAGGPQ